MTAPGGISKIKYQISKLWPFGLPRKGRLTVRTENRRSAMMSSLILHSALCISILLVAGCQKETADTGSAIELKLEELTRQNEQLAEQVDQSKTENKELKDRLQVLSGLPEDVRLENLYSVERIKIGRLSGFFDKDKDGKREKMIVYVTPVDKQGDGIKATGAVNVQLWDLNRADGEALLGEWDVEPDELKKSWFKTLVAVNYRLVFDVPDGVENLDEQLTARITFTDYLGGKVFKDQRVIKPR
jgi:cell division protein FtsB